MLTPEQVATLTDEDIRACVIAQHPMYTADKIEGYVVAAWRDWLGRCGQETDINLKALAKAREILASRQARVVGNGGEQARYRPVTDPTPRHSFVVDGVRVSFGKPVVGVKEGIIVLDDPAPSPLPDAADAIFRFLCGLDGTVTARWLSVADQREFERLRRGLGEALMAVGRGRR